MSAFPIRPSGVSWADPGSGASKNEQAPAGNMTAASAARGSEPPRALPDRAGLWGQFVTFRLDARTYALPLEHVEGVLRMVAVTPVPEAPGWVAGVIDLRGRAVAVVDLRARLGMEVKPPHPDDRLVLIHAQGRTVGLVVDEATDVLDAAGLVEPPPEPLRRSEPVLCVIRGEGHMALVLDTAKLIPEHQVAAAVHPQPEGETHHVPRNSTGETGK